MSRNSSANQNPYKESVPFFDTFSKEQGNNLQTAQFKSTSSPQEFDKTQGALVLMAAEYERLHGIIQVLVLRYKDLESRFEAKEKENNELRHRINSLGDSNEKTVGLNIELDRSKGQIADLIVQVEDLQSKLREKDKEIIELKIKGPDSIAISTNLVIEREELAKKKEIPYNSEPIRTSDHDLKNYDYYSKIYDAPKPPSELQGATYYLSDNKQHIEGHSLHNSGEYDYKPSGELYLQGEDLSKKYGVKEEEFSKKYGIQGYSDHENDYLKYKEEQKIQGDDYLKYGSKDYKIIQGEEYSNKKYVSPLGDDYSSQKYKGVEYSGQKFVDYDYKIQEESAHKYGSQDDDYSSQKFAGSDYKRPENEYSSQKYGALEYQEEGYGSKNYAGYEEHPKKHFKEEDYSKKYEQNYQQEDDSKKYGLEYNPLIGSGITQSREYEAGQIGGEKDYKGYQYQFYEERNKY